MCEALQKLIEEERAEVIAEEMANIDSRIAEAVAEEKARTDIATATRMLKIGKYSHDEISMVSTLSRGEVDHLAISMGL